MNQRHVEFFGADLGRGPFAASRMDAAALQIATALAQLRAPLLRSDDDILAHGEFIRQLADRLAPDYSAYVGLDVSKRSSAIYDLTVRVNYNASHVLDVWLADSIGSGVTGNSPTSVAFTLGSVMETIAANRHYRVLTTETGLLAATVTYTGGARTWYAAAARQGRGYYSYGMYFG